MSRCEPSTGSVTINGAAGTVVSQAQDGRVVVPPNPILRSQGTAAQYGLQEGNVYKITVFQAERQRDGSSFQLTLAGFDAIARLQADGARVIYGHDDAQWQGLRKGGECYA